MPDSRKARADAIEELLEADRQKTAPKKATPAKKASGTKKA